MAIASKKKQDQAKNDISKRRAEIKKQLNEYFGTQNKNKSVPEKLTDIYSHGFEMFKKKGYDDQTAHNKTMAAIGIFVPEGYAIYYNKTSEKIELAKVL